jgi:hypothetical protein
MDRSNRVRVLGREPGRDQAPLLIAISTANTYTHVLTDETELDDELCLRSF